MFFYWSRFTLLLDHVKSLDDTIILVSLVFLILVTLTPVSYIVLLQLKSQTAMIFSTVDQILAGLFLILSWRILAKGEVVSTKARYYLIQISVIPAIYSIALAVSFLSFTFALIIPLSILPVFLLIRFSYQKYE